MAAVLRYNVLSPFLVALVNRYLGIPLVGYFDEFAAIVRKTLGRAALGAFTRSCSLLGFQLKEAKSAVGPAVVFLGLLGHFPCAGNVWGLSISLPEEKRAEWSSPAILLYQGGANSPPLFGGADGSFIFPPYRFFWEIRPLPDAPAVSEISPRGLSRSITPPMKRPFPAGGMMLLPSLYPAWPFLGLSGRAGLFILTRPPIPHILFAFVFRGNRSPLYCIQPDRIAPPLFGRISSARLR